MSQFDYNGNGYYSPRARYGADYWAPVEAKYQSGEPDFLEIEVIRDVWFPQAAGWLPSGHALFEHRRNSGRKP